MSEIKDGGPAFPFERSDAYLTKDLVCSRCGHAVPGFTTQERGMTLRDWLAGQALMGLCGDSEYSGSFAEFAKFAYGVADAMIAERNKQQESK